MKRKIFVLFLVLLAIAPLYALKIACVDMQKVMLSSEEIKTESKKMEEMVKKGKNALKPKEDDLLKLQKKMQQDGRTATDEAKAAMLEEYQRKAMELQRLADEKQKELQNKEAMVQAEFIEKVKKLAMEVAIKKGYEIVLPKEQCLYINDKYDITKFVIELINK